ncbi:hypothetical protein HDU76_009391, partial [Blyttiomyces sp. JEL0837]
TATHQSNIIMFYHSLNFTLHLFITTIQNRSFAIPAVDMSRVCLKGKMTRKNDFLSSHLDMSLITAAPQPSSSVPRPLFAYGSLMSISVFLKVMGRSPEYPPPKTQKAILKGYRRQPVKGAWYPGIKLNPSYSVEGLVVHLTNFGELDRLDKFEGDDYERVTVSVELVEGGEVVDADVYVWRHGENTLEDREWSFEDFERDRLEEVDAEVRMQQNSKFAGPLTWYLNGMLTEDEVEPYGVDIWNQAFSSQWDLANDISLIPVNQLPTIKNGLGLVTSKSTYKKLCSLRNDLTNITKINMTLTNTPWSC